MYPNKMLLFLIRFSYTFSYAPYICAKGIAFLQKNFDYPNYGSPSTTPRFVRFASRSKRGSSSLASSLAFSLDLSLASSLAFSLASAGIPENYNYLVAHHLASVYKSCNRNQLAF